MERESHMCMNRMHTTSGATSELHHMIQRDGLIRYLGPPILDVLHLLIQCHR
jgi:hypothetical protein